MPALTTKRSSSRQAYGTCLCPAEHEIDARPLEALERVACVVDDVPLAAGARHRQQVVVHDEDAQVGRIRELLLDPAVAAAADLPVVEVGLGRVDRDERDAVLAQHRVAVAEQLLEVDVADVAGVVVARDDDHRLAVDRVEVALRERVLVLEAVRGQVARDDDDVGRELVRLGDRALEQVRQEELLPAVEVGQLDDREGTSGPSSMPGSLEDPGHRVVAARPRRGPPRAASGATR